jgi:LuxR family maltose regulon positive regulatory protein
MAFLSPPNGLPAGHVDGAPFRFMHPLPLILTRFTPPRTAGTLLQRDRLLHQLDNASCASLTLVCAAAGFGKTTLLAQWYRQRQQQGDALAWLSLEEDDNSPALFMRYLLAALRPLSEGLHFAFSDDSMLFMAQLSNALHACSHPIYLVLDDYHCISNPAIHAGMNWLLQHAPDCLHVIIGSRTRLPFSLSRMQIQDRYVEINDQQLRFNLHEAEDYFMQSSMPALQQQDIVQLMALTEGWVAGMKMVALASPDVDHRPHLAGELRAGSRSVARYLDEVIFAPLPPEILLFLMQTAMLNRLHPDLCDSVTNSNQGRSMLAWVEQHNLFVSALDEKGLWFRYHPLMRDALYQRLTERDDIDIGRLHERAGNWFAAQQLWAEAIRHAVAAGKSVTRHAEAGAQSLAEEGDIDTMVRWIRYLPATPDPSRIDLQLNLAWALAHHFHFADARQLLDAIDATVATLPETLVRPTRVKQQVVRAICEAFADNISDSIAIVQPLLKEVPCGDVWVDGLVCNILSYCHLALAQPQQTLSVQQHFPVGLTKNSNLFIEVYRAFVLSLSHLRQGNLQEAERLASQALRYAEQQTGTNSSSVATLTPLLAAVASERGDGVYARSLLIPHLSMIDDFCPADGVSLCYRVLARQAMLDARQDEALKWLAHAEQLSQRRGWWRVRSELLAARLTLTLVIGQAASARTLFDELAAVAGDKHNPIADWHLAMCESLLLLANHQAREAVAGLATILPRQEEHGETLFALRTRLQLAVAYWQAGEKNAAAQACQPALERAVQQHLVQCLKEVEADLAALLGWMRESTSAAGTGVDTLAGAETLLGISPPSPSSPLRLTEREQQTLQLIAEGNSNKAIARLLGISVETVKWHLKQLYEKLDVNGRMQAVNKARALGARL